MSTDDFIAFVNASTGQDLTAFLRDWLYGTTTPQMPGHLDWTVDPAAAASTATTAAAPLSPRGLEQAAHSGRPLGRY